AARSSPLPVLALLLGDPERPLQAADRLVGAVARALPAPRVAPDPALAHVGALLARQLLGRRESPLELLVGAEVRLHLLEPVEHRLASQQQAAGAPLAAARTERVVEAADRLEPQLSARREHVELQLQL